MANKKGISYTIWASLLAVVISTSVDAQELPATKVSESVTYVELPTGGPLVSTGRTLKTDGNGNYGIDINSKLLIKLDRTKLKQALASSLAPEDKQRAQDLIAVLDDLIRASGLTKAAIEQTSAAIEAYDKAIADKNYSAFENKAKEMGATVFSVLSALQKAKSQRLQMSGIARNDADRLSKTMFDRVLRKGKDPYDWSALGSLFAEEITSTQKELDAVIEKLGVQLEIQAHILTKDGQNHSVFLPGYNEVETGPTTAFVKMKYEATQEQLDLYNKNKELVKSIGETKSLGDAILKALEGEFREQRLEIETLSASIDMALKGTWDKFTTMEKWSSKKAQADWINNLNDELEKTEQGKEVLKQWSVVAKDMSSVGDAAGFVKEFSQFHTKIAEMDSVQALQVVVSTLKRYSDLKSDQNPILAITPKSWDKYQTDIVAFLDAVKKLAPITQASVLKGGPIGDLTDILTPIKDLKKVVSAENDSIASLLIRLLVVPPADMAADLPLPKGTKQINVLAATDTSIDLTTVKQQRSENDTLQVQYRLLHNDHVFEGGWIDRFRIRIFGWYDNFFAGFAFVNQNNNATWRPTATLSWIMSKRCWPRSDQSGLSGLEDFEWFSGFGLTTMPLNFTENQEVEFGIAPTLSFLNNRILVGYGTDLQASHNAGFWFFSIRLLGSSGFFPK